MINNLYNAEQIKVLKGLEAIKKRPGMYIGDTDNGQGLHQMVYELIDNSIDEALMGYCNIIKLNLYKDGSISVKDNGRGIPIDIHKEENKLVPEIIMTVLHSGAKFDNNSYKNSGGLHGVGLSVVNALSKKLYLQIFRNNKIYFQFFNYGFPNKPKIFIRNNIKNINGTLIRFWPNKFFFSNILNFNLDILINRLRELAFLNKNLNIILIDNIFNKKKYFLYKGGIIEYIKYINKKNKYSIINKKIFYLNIVKNNITIELAMQWNISYDENILCFTNNIYQKEGGVHLSGLKTAITKSINNYLYNKKINILGEDTREGLIAILSIKMSDPKFSSQTKDKLVSSEIRPTIESIVYENLNIFLQKNTENTKLIINKIINNYKNREIIKKTKEITRKHNILDQFTLSGKLAECQENRPELCEIYLVEGDSAGGSAKQARNRRYQAILPLKGKILNVEKVSFDKMLSSKEIINLITALGCSITKTKDFNLNQLKYHRIIIMTDADIDGLHIRSLLLTFFYKYIPDIIKKGYIYIAQPPLYKIKFFKKEKYLLDEKQLQYYITDLLINNISVYIKNKLTKINYYLSKNKLKKIILQYYKINNLIEKLKIFYPINFLKLLRFYNIKNNFYSYQKLLNWINKIVNILNKKNLKSKYDFYINNENYKIGFKLLQSKFKIINKEFFIYNSFFYSKDYKILTSLQKQYNLIFSSNNKVYLKDKKNILLKKHINNFEDIIKFINKYFLPKINIQRYKGLGEMNPLQLWETTMNPNSRRIIKIVYKNNEKIDYIFKQLMGNNVNTRKMFIHENYFKIENLDI